jgi:hypothetical protein
MSTYTAVTAPTQFVEANGIRYARRRWGKRSGLPPVFNHHLKGNLDNWDPAVLDGLAKEREVAGGDFVIVHGRFSGFGAPVNWIAADIVRLQDGILLEHWDVIQDEVTQEQSKTGLPMFGDKFPQ